MDLGHITQSSSLPTLRSQLACFANAKFQFIFRKRLLCLYSPHDSSPGLSLASGFCTYSILPNSCSLNIGSMLFHWQYFLFVCFVRNLTSSHLHWKTCGVWEMQRPWSQTKLGGHILACCLLAASCRTCWLTFPNFTFLICKKKQRYVSYRSG